MRTCTSVAPASLMMFTRLPLVVPLTLLGHHARVHAVGNLNGQTFLEPDPRELMLRNHV